MNWTPPGDPWYDPKLLDRDRQKQISDLGFNVVRLGAMWTGVEPLERQYNKTYLDILEVGQPSRGKMCLVQLSWEAMW